MGSHKIRLLGFCLFCLGAACAPAVPAAPAAQAPAQVGKPLHDIYLPEPSFQTAMDGSFATGIAFGDVNGDGLPDLVTANGNDMSPQPLMVYYNRCSSTQNTCFGTYPDWYSGDIDYLGGVALGDLDHDGWLDVAVSVALDKARSTAGGGVKIYKNQKGRLDSLPAQRIAEGYGAFDCVLGDVNADGLLDLVVPAFDLPPDSPAPHGPRAVLRMHAQSPLTPARIYLNEGGKLHTISDWKSDDGLFGFSALAADLDQDGWMDVAFGGHRAVVYRGGPPGGSAKVPIEPRAAWASEPTHGLILSIDAGRIGVEAPLTLAVSRGCVPGTTCTGDFALFRLKETAPVWRSETTELGSMLLLADLNADGLLDLVGGQWGTGVSGAPLWFFQGRAGALFSSQPDFRTSGTGIAVAEGLAVADTRGVGTTERTFTWRAKKRGAIVTLPDRRVSQIVTVSVAGRRMERWAFAPQENWISLAQPYEPGAEVRVTYRASSVQDLIEATWDPQRGNLLYDSFLTNPSQRLKEKQP